MPFTLKKTLQLVLKSGNDYLVAVRGNQGKLYEHLQTFERHLRPISQQEQVNRGRGRCEHRRVKVYSPSGFEEMGWVGVQSILCVERWGTRKGKAYEHQVYYISSILTSAKQWLALIRGHWGIENRYHWPKDAIFGEDDYRLEDGAALRNWSLVRTIVINILRLHGFESLKAALRKLANRIDKIFPLLT